MTRSLKAKNKYIALPAKLLFILSAVLLISLLPDTFKSTAATANNLPNGGISVALGDGNDLETVVGAGKTTEAIEQPITTKEQAQKMLLSRSAAASDDGADIGYELGYENFALANCNDYLVIFSEADEASEVLGKLYKDCVCNICSENEDGWCLIESGELTGYVHGEYLLTGDEAASRAEAVGKWYAVVDSSLLYVREADFYSAAVLGIVKSGDMLSVVETKGDWFGVETADGEGFVNSEYVTLTRRFNYAESTEEEQIRLAEESYANGEALVEYALQFVGNPYKYGGTSLTNGCDCSGFTQSVYAHFGISLARGSEAQRYEGVRISSVEEAQPGDIFYYYGHVAIYIGNGQIVHACNSRRGIVVDDYTLMNLVDIRRIF